MKLHDFGLWFQSPNNHWSTEIPQNQSFSIYYHGECIAYQIDHYPFVLQIFSGTTHTIKLKIPSVEENLLDYHVGRKLTLNDFEIIPNPYDKGLWFGELSDGRVFKWSKTIPTTKCAFLIDYDGIQLGRQYTNFQLSIHQDTPHIIKLNIDLKPNYSGEYDLRRKLTNKDFQIIPNPHWNGLPP